MTNLVKFMWGGYQGILSAEDSVPKNVPLHEKRIIDYWAGGR